MVHLVGFITKERNDSLVGYFLQRIRKVIKEVYILTNASQRLEFKSFHWDGTFR